MTKSESIIIYDISKEILQAYADNIRYLERLKNIRRNICLRIGNLKSIDFSKIKVTNGDSRHTSEQERYALKLEKINKEITECEAWCKDCRQKIISNIRRIHKHEYRKILIYRYLELWKWSEIIQDFFEFETDFEEEKEGKYKQNVMYWHRAALQELENLRYKVFIPTKQEILKFHNDS